MKLRVKRTPEERFWAQVKKTAGCWIWTGCVTDARNLYGNISVNGKPVRTHRYSWELHNGKIPDGAAVLHRCDNPRCVRPDHLFIGTQTENIADRTVKGRTACGQRKPNSKLTPEMVRSIRARYRAGESCKSIARSFGVSYPTIYYAAKGVNHKHVKDHPTPPTAYDR